MFKVGDEVVCVDASPSLYTKEKILSQGSVYVVERFDTERPDPSGNRGIHLVGVRTPVFLDGLDLGWAMSRFRKVQRRDLTEWLSTAAKHTDHIDKRSKVPA